MNNSLLAVQTQLPKMTLNKASALQSTSPTYFASLVEQLAKPITSDLGSTALPSDPKAAEIDTESMEDMRTVLQAFLSQYKNEGKSTDDQQTGHAQANKAVTAWDFIEQSMGKETLEEMLPDGMKERLAAGLKEMKLEEGTDPVTFLSMHLEQLSAESEKDLKKNSWEEFNVEAMLPEQSNDTKQTVNAGLAQGEAQEAKDSPERTEASDYQQQSNSVVIHTDEQADIGLTERQTSYLVSAANHNISDQGFISQNKPVNQPEISNGQIDAELDSILSETNQLNKQMNQVLASNQNNSMAESLSVNIETTTLTESTNNGFQQTVGNFVNSLDEMTQNIIASKNLNVLKQAATEAPISGTSQQTTLTTSSSVMAKATTDQMTANNGKVLQNTVSGIIQELNGEIVSNIRKPDNAIVALSARQQFAAMMHQKAEVQSKQSAQQTVLQQKSEVVSENDSAVADKSVALPNLQTSKPEQLIFHLKQAAASQEAAGKELVEKLEQVMLQRPEIRSGAMELSIKLRPHNLGDIQIKLLQQDGQTMVQIMTSSKQAKEMLDANVSSLKHIFAPHQITLMDRTDHLPASNAERSFDQSKQNGGQAGQERREQQQETDYDDQSFSEFMSEFERSSK